MPTVQAMLPVFPAYAGMIPAGAESMRHAIGVPRIRGDDPRGMKNRKQARANRLLSQVCTGTSGNAKSYPTTEKSKATWLDTEADQRSRL